MSTEFSTFADGSECKECAAAERKIKQLTERLAAAEAALKLRTAELAACKSACQGEMESADEYKAERDECRWLLREACEMPRYCTRFEEWKERAAKAGGGE